MDGTQHFHCYGSRLNPWSGNQDPMSLAAWSKNRKRQVLVQASPWSPIMINIYLNIKNVILKYENVIFNYHYILLNRAWKERVKVKAAQLCPTLCDSMDYSLLGSSVQGISQAIILEWVVISFSRGSSQPRDWTQVSGIASGFFTSWATREALIWLGHI